MPPPAAMTAERKPTAEGSRAGGDSSRRMPNDSGNAAPPRPWTTRPTSTKRQGRRQGGDERAEGDRGEGEHQGALLARDVADPAEQRRRDGGGQQPGGEDPGDRGGRRPQVVLDGRQHRRDQGLQHGEAGRGRGSCSRVLWPRPRPPSPCCSPWSRRCCRPSSTTWGRRPPRSPGSSPPGCCPPPSRRRCSAGSATSRARSAPWCSPSPRSPSARSSPPWRRP